MTDQYEWPTEPGTYPLATTEGYEDEWQLGFDGKWTCGEVKTRPFSTSEMKSDGYLGVRREKTKPDDAIYVSPQPQPEDNAAIAKQALAEWRECKQSPKAADWAYRWAHRLCVMMGAE